MIAAHTSAKAKPPVLRLPVAGLAAAFLGLAVALLVGSGAGGYAAAGLVGLSGVLVLGELVRRGVAAARAGAWRLVAITTLSVLVLVTGSTVVGSFLNYVFGWATLFGALGAGLLAASTEGLRSGPGTPWQALASGHLGESREERNLLLRVLTGVWLLLVSAYLAIQAVDDAWRYHSLRLTALLVGAALVLGGALGVFVWLRLVDRRAPRSSAGGPTIRRDEQVVAAHLHDSVLQTLSLIQRNASDPARVAQLARQQERSLRAWLAGRDDAQGDTLAGAVRLVAQEVEDGQPGAVVEVVAVGDAPLDREADAMVRAAREAMRNAVRHAGSPVRVFVEVEDGARELFVRDTGPGFDLDAVADERRGVRDAIIGRMEHVGGSVTIDSTASGTEIALRLPSSSGGGSR